MKSVNIRTLLLVGVAVISMAFCGCSKEQPQQGLDASDVNTSSTEEICTNGEPHQWSDPVYTWINDNTACTAEHTCSECGSMGKETVNAVLTVDENGNGVLNAEFEDEDFSSQQQNSENMNSVEAAFKVSDVKGKAGDTVVVTVSMENNPGIIAAGLEIRYDRDQLELVSVTDKKLLADGTFSKEYTDYPYILTWNDALAENNTMDNGVLAELTFCIKDGASGESEVTVGYNPGNVFDVDLNNVVFRTVSGTVTVR